LGQTKSGGESWGAAKQKVREFGIRCFFEAIGVRLPPKHRFNASDKDRPFDDTKDDVFDMLMSLIEEGRRMLLAERKERIQERMQKSIRMAGIDASRIERPRGISRRLAKRIVKMDPKEAGEYEAHRTKNKRKTITIGEGFEAIGRAKKMLKEV